MCGLGWGLKKNREETYVFWTQVEFPCAMRMVPEWRATVRLPEGGQDFKSGGDDTHLAHVAAENTLFDSGTAGELAQCCPKCTRHHASTRTPSATGRMSNETTNSDRTSKETKYTVFDTMEPCTIIVMGAGYTEASEGKEKVHEPSWRHVGGQHRVQVATKPL